jgi:PII-like signaling protein
LTAAQAVPALKLTIYLNETLRSENDLAADRLLGLFERSRVRAGALLRGIEGFGATHRLHTGRLENASLNQPVIAIAVDERERIESMMHSVDGILMSELVTTERAWLCDLPVAALPEVAHDSVKLTVYCGRAERADGAPAYRAIVDHLRGCGASGATAFLGVDGTVHGERRRARFLSRNRDVPVMIVSVGPPDAMAQAAAGLERLADRPVVTVEGIQICKRDGELLEAPRPASAPRDAPMWRKLMVHAPGDTHVGGEALHQLLVEQLRRNGAAGATSLRGIWGFSGGGAPHGDSALALRRPSPVVTIAIDHANGMDGAWQAVDELTGGAGLVTSELVPGHRAIPVERSVRRA